jgi:hypothetical protein
MTNAHVVSRSPSSIEIGFKGRDFADAYKVFIDPNLDRATIAIDKSGELHSQSRSRTQIPTEVLHTVK